MSFLQHAAAHGLLIRDLIADGRWHRVPTSDHPRKRNGAYAFDGQRGAVQNWATMQDVAVFRPDGAEKISRAVFRQQVRQSIEEQRARYARGRDEAAALIKECQRGTHPYLSRKGFPIAQGLVHPTGDLIIPMRDFQDYWTVNSAQRISPDGTKLFVKDGKAKGSVFIIARGAWRERWLCEGYATGLSVQAALLDLRRQAEIVICFSAGNLQHVAPMVKKPAFVMADCDESGAGQRAAEATCLPWVMPAEVGTDANDVQQRHGLRALVALIRGIES